MQQGTTPSPTAEELKKAAQGQQSDLVLQSFNVTNLIIFNQTLFLVLKMGDQIMRNWEYTED